MKIILNQFTKILGLIISTVFCATVTVFSFSGNWLKSLAIFAIALPIGYFAGSFVIYLARKIFPFGKNANINIAMIPKKKIWIMIVFCSIFAPVFFGIIDWADDTSDYNVSFTRIIVAIVLSFIAAVFANLLFVKEFCKGNKEIEN